MDVNENDVIFLLKSFTNTVGNYTNCLIKNLAVVFLTYGHKFCRNFPFVITTPNFSFSKWFGVIDFRFRNKFRKIRLLVMYYLTKLMM